MLEQAVRDFNIDLTQSYLIGDSGRDIACGVKAGVKTIKVKRNQIAFTSALPADHACNSLHEAVSFILLDEKKISSEIIRLNNLEDTQDAARPE